MFFESSDIFLENQSCQFKMVRNTCSNLFRPALVVHSSKTDPPLINQSASLRINSVTTATMRSKMALGMKTRPMVYVPAIEYARISSADTHVTRRCEADLLSATKKGTPETKVARTS